MGLDPNQVGIFIILITKFSLSSCIFKGILKKNLHVSNIPNMAVFTSSILYNAFNADFSNAMAMDSHWFFLIKMQLNLKKNLSVN